LITKIRVATEEFFCYVVLLLLNWSWSWSYNFGLDLDLGLILLVVVLVLTCWSFFPSLDDTQTDRQTERQPCQCAPYTTARPYKQTHHASVHCTLQQQQHSDVGSN